MDKDTIDKNKERFIALCKEHIRREGMDKLLAYLENSDFFTAPSSASFHLNEEGGLCLHSINVFETAVKLYQHIALPAIQNGTSPFTEEIPMESIAIASLLHDLCKVKFYHPTERWKKDESGRWVSYPGYELKDEFPFGHGEKSCLMISWYMRLKPEEMLAIRWHMGMFDMAENGTSQRYAYYAATDKCALVNIIQAADMLASKLMEKTTTY